MTPWRRGVDDVICRHACRTYAPPFQIYDAGWLPEPTASWSLYFENKASPFEGHEVWGRRSINEGLISFQSFGQCTRSTLLFPEFMSSWGTSQGNVGMTRPPGARAEQAFLPTSHLQPVLTRERTSLISRAVGKSTHLVRPLMLTPQYK